jgi:hypothetical protein
MYDLKRLRRLRWLVFLVVVLGIGSSVAMNVLHAPENPAARFVSALPPIAVFGALELMTRIPSSSRGMSAVRISGATIVALIAAAISYAQQAAAILDLGFPGWEAQLWPVLIDGFMIVASVSLVEVVRKIREVEAPGPAAAVPSQRGAVGDEPEEPKALEYRQAVAADRERLRKESSLAAMNGSKAA